VHQSLVFLVRDQGHRTLTSNLSIGHETRDSIGDATGESLYNVKYNNNVF